MSINGIDCSSLTPHFSIRDGQNKPEAKTASMETLPAELDMGHIERAVLAVNERAASSTGMRPAAPEESHGRIASAANERAVYAEGCPAPEEAALFFPSQEEKTKILQSIERYLEKRADPAGLEAAGVTKDALLQKIDPESGSGYMTTGNLVKAVLGHRAETEGGSDMFGGLSAYDRRFQRAL